MTNTGLALAFVAGAGLGAVYFVLLWLSVQHFTHTGKSWIFVAGVAGRILLIVGALVWALNSGVPAGHLAIACLGFLAARLGAKRIVGQRERTH